MLAALLPRVEGEGDPPGHVQQAEVLKRNDQYARQNHCTVLPNDSAVAKEQRKIEKQLKDVQQSVWGKPEPKDSLDSIAQLDKKACQTLAKAQSVVPTRIKQQR